MSSQPPEIETAIREASETTWADVVRAKRAILELVDDGEPHGIATIQRVLHTVDNVPVPTMDRRAAVEVPATADIASVVTPDHPVIAGMRLAWAASEALIDLVSMGVLVEVAESPRHSAGNAIIDRNRGSVGYKMARGGSSVDLTLPFPAFARAYRLAPRYAATQPWFVDVDLFTEDLGTLGLDDRALRCVAEALAAFRGGLYLACANLLGAASEAAWYAAGERLRDVADSRLVTALDGDQTVKVIERVKEVLRQHRPNRGVVDGVGSTASLLLELRNYGVHPRAQDEAHLERYFTEATAAVLVIETHAYLMRLAGAVDARLVEPT